MRIRIGPGGRLLSVVVVAILTLPIMQGSPVSAQLQPPFGGPTSSPCIPGFAAPANPTFVQIDLKPGNAKNNVNVQSGGLVEIAICSEDADGPGGAPPTFDATTEVYVVCNDPTAFPFPQPSSPSCKPRDPNGPAADPVGVDPAGTPKAGTSFVLTEYSLHSCPSERDVNGDGVKDLVCKFFISLMNLTGTPDETVNLKGCCKTPEFQGSDFANFEGGGK